MSGETKIGGDPLIIAEGNLEIGQPNSMGAEAVDGIAKFLNEVNDFFVSLTADNPSEVVAIALPPALPLDADPRFLIVELDGSIARLSFGDAIASIANFWARSTSPDVLSPASPDDRVVLDGDGYFAKRQQGGGSETMLAGYKAGDVVGTDYPKYRVYHDGVQAWGDGSGSAEDASTSRVSAGIIATDTATSFLFQLTALFKLISTPSAPAAGRLGLFADTADGHLKRINSSGTVVDLESTGSGGITELTGDATAGPGSGSVAATIAAGVVTNAKLANMATQTIKGRTTAGTGVPEDLTASQVRTLLSLVIGTNVQAWDADLDTVAANITAFGQSLIAAANAAAARTALGAAGGTGTANGTNTGDQTISLTGDVTGSGTGSFAATIANDAVTFAKMQNIANATLIGRDVAGTGDAQAITLDDTLEMDGSGRLQRAALTGAVTAAAGSNTLAIEDDSVTYAKIQNVSTTDRLLGRSSAGAGDVQEITCTAFGRSLIDDAAASNARTTLGIIGQNPLGTIYLPAKLASSLTGAALLTAIGTNQGYDVLTFTEAGNLYAFWTVEMPLDYNGGTVTMHVTWKQKAAETPTKNVQWIGAGYVGVDLSTWDSAMGTQQVIVDETDNSTTKLRVSPETPAITFGGSPASATAGQSLTFKLSRNGAAGADTSTVDAYAYGVTLTYTRV